MWPQEEEVEKWLSNICLFKFSGQNGVPSERFQLSLECQHLTETHTRGNDNLISISCSQLKQVNLWSLSILKKTNRGKEVKALQIQQKEPLWATQISCLDFCPYQPKLLADSELLTTCRPWLAWDSAPVKPGQSPVSIEPRDTKCGKSCNSYLEKHSISFQKTVILPVYQQHGAVGFAVS